jgi:hypothetical protein
VELTHASFFSGVGGTDLGLERAGWHTVSFSEVDPYACAVLSERWPGVPNLGDIVALSNTDHGGCDASGECCARTTRTLGAAMGHHGYTMGAQDADGGYLQVARPINTQKGHYDPDTDNYLVSTSPDSSGVREADGLAGRPHDRQVMAFAQNQRDEIRDLEGQAGALAGQPGMKQQTFLAFVKSAGPREEDGEESWIEGRVMPTLNSFDVGDIRTTAAIVSPTLTAPGMEGGRRDKIPQVVQSLDTKRGGPDDNEAQAGHLVEGGGVSDDELLPLGLDSHRYRCCGNGVVAPVAEWIGRQLLTTLEKAA